MSAPGLQVKLYAKVLAVVLLPLVSMIFLLGFFLVEARLADIENVHKKRGELIAKSLSKTSEYGVFSGDSEALQAVIDALVAENSDVESAGLLDAEAKVLVRSAEFETSHIPDLRPLPAFQAHERHSLFAAPIGTDVPTVTDFDAERADAHYRADHSNVSVLGWAVVQLSHAQSREMRKEVLTGSTLTIGTSLVIAILLSVTIGKGITHRIQRLSETIGQVQQGDLSARVKRPSDDEFGRLEAGFNQMAASLQSAQSLLRQRVSEATTKLQQTVSTLEEKNEALRILSERATEASREKADFLAKMSHEIRTPLNAVIGFSRIINKTSEPDKIIEHASTIDRAASQLLYVVDGILDYSRLESGQLDLESVRIDPRVHLENTVVMLNTQAQDKGLELILHLHNGLPATIFGDPHRLNQLVMNLVSNAIKFTQAGYVLVEASVDSTRHGEGELAVRVSDTGIGLTEQEQDRLFHPFTQADSSISRLYGGTGLGLAIVQNLIALMNGTLNVTSEKGIGSAFEFRVPCRVGDHHDPKTQTIGLAGRSGLIIDENPITRRALLSMLVDTGATLYAAGDCAELGDGQGPPSCIDHRVDFIVAGVGRDGDDPLLRTVERALRAGLDKPVLLLVNDERWRPPEFIATHPAVAWIAKPARRTPLHETLGTLLQPAAPNVNRPEQNADDLAANGSRDRLHVLFAEDNAFNREYLRRILEDQGIAAEEADGGAEAVELAMDRPFDLIFLDIHMPGMDGVEACRRIRDRLGEDAPPIIALTADLFFDEHFSTDKGLFDDRLFKPIAPDALENVLSDWTATVRSGGPGSLQAPPQDIGPGSPDGGRSQGTPLPASLSARLAEELRELGDSLIRAYEREDWAGLVACSHQFHGLVALYGQHELTAAAREIENAARTASWKRLPPVMERFSGLLQGLHRGTDA